MRGRNSIWLLAVAATAVIGLLLVYWHRQGRVTAPSRPGEAPAQNEAANQSTNRVIPARPNQVLAMVNSTPITLGDLMPLQSTNSAMEQTIDAATYNYLLQRAIDRELVLQAAKAQGITLNQDQQEQLTKLQAERGQPEPGLVSKLTVNAAEIEFELRDAQAFMLQTSLMAQAGATPDVTSDQVEQYYQNHIAELGALPDDPQARQAAWQEIDIKIRNQLASQMRNQYNVQLQKFMDHLRTAAQVTVTPLS